MFDRVRPGGSYEGAEFLAPVVARALARLGRGAEAQALLAKVAAAMPAEDGGNALNIEGSLITLASLRTDWPQVIAHADTFLARARSLGSNVNRSAVIQVQAWRACALSHTGSTAEAQLATAQVLLDAVTAPDAAMDMLLCRGDEAAARALVIARLADETTRDWALYFVQPAPVSMTMPLDLLLDPAAERVRTAPDVVAAANRVGRILPAPVDAALPKGFDPFRAQPTVKPPSPGSI